MSTITLENIRAAEARIRPHIPATPLTRSFYLSSKWGLDIFLKMENLNLSGSFKIRGASNALLSATPEQLANGVVATSAGNHAQGVARTAHMLGVKATIFMPEQAPLVKIESTKRLGATVVLAGNTYDEAEAAARTWNEEHQAFMIHPFADPAVICGQGTIALEILDQVPDPGAIIVPIGGGGLISGVACAIKALSPATRILGVQSKLFPSMERRFHHQAKSRDKVTSPSLADGIAVKQVSPVTYGEIREHVDEIYAVSEEEIAAGIMELMERDHVLVEGAGAVSVAALEQIGGFLQEEVLEKPVICLLSGGNIDVSLLHRITRQGLLHTGRIMRLEINLSDQPGALVKLLEKISSLGANLYNINHNRVFSGYGVKTVEVIVDLETFNREHQQEIRTSLDEAGYQVK